MLDDVDIGEYIECKLIRGVGIVDQYEVRGKMMDVYSYVFRLLLCNSRIAVQDVEFNTARKQNIVLISTIMPQTLLKMKLRKGENRGKVWYDLVINGETD